MTVSNVVRFAILLAAIAGTLSVQVATGADLPPSALSLAATALAAPIALLLWPGAGPTPKATASGIVAWSAAATAAAAIAMALAGATTSSFARTWPAGAVLFAILIVAQGFVAWIERRLCPPGGNAANAREIAGRAVALMLTVLGALPLWLGPAAEWLAARHPWSIDAVIGASPLTHLAVASGNDLLRNAWLYQNANLASLRFSYPETGEIAPAYLALVVTLASAAGIAVRKRRRTHPDVMLTEPFP